jgi:type IV secretory pathway TraG/TraD family ATPase VirD4
VRSRTPAKILIGKGAKPLLRLYRSWFMRRGGSSVFSNLLDEWANHWKAGMILLGASIYDHNWLVGVKDDRHMLTISSPGGGKGRSAILPNLLTYVGSVLCLDVKGQNAAVSARARQERLKQKVRVVAPMGAPQGLEDMIARFNPLTELYPESEDYAEQVDLIADALVIPGGDKSQFWDENARTVIAGLIDYVVRASLQEEWDSEALRLEDHSREEVQ